MEAEADWDNLRTPETYLGYGRSEHFASPGGAAFDQRHAYELPEQLPFNHRDGRMYQLVRQHDAVRERTMKITFLSPGVEAYVFTFG